MSEEGLTLKWGTVKGWDNLSEASQEILRRYFADGEPLSAMSDRPNPDRVAILCELIEQLNGEIWNDWDGVIMSKEDAKKYVQNYAS